MRILGHGIDIVETSRIALMLEEHPERFLDRIFTAQEQADSESSKRRIEHLAARFAAKEAALKALGTGWSRGIAWTDVSIMREPSGKPNLLVVGRANEVAAEIGISDWQVSLSHTESHAIASVIASGDK